MHKFVWRGLLEKPRGVEEVRSLLEQFLEAGSVPYRTTVTGVKPIPPGLLPGVEFANLNPHLVRVTPTGATQGMLVKVDCFLSYQEILLAVQQVNKRLRVRT